MEHYLENKVTDCPVFDNNKEYDTMYREKDGLYYPRRHEVMSTRPADLKLHFNMVMQPQFTRRTYRTQFPS